MAEKNLYINRLLCDPVYFADLVNGVLFGGRQRLKPSELTPVADASGVTYVEPGGVKRVVERHRDVTMKAVNGQSYAVIALENQADVHYAMPVRSMLYDALDYADQVRKLAQVNRESGEKLTGAELLSGLKKGDRLTPVVTIVLYWGTEPWEGCKSVHQLLGLEDEGVKDSVRELAQYIPDYRINLVNAADPGDLTRFQTHLQQIFGVLKYNHDKAGLFQYLHENREPLREMSETAKQALFSVMGEQKRLMLMLEEQKDEEALDMCSAIDELIADGEKRGEERGEKRGEKRGEERGVKRGEERLSNLIARLLDEGQTDLIRQVTRDAETREQLYQRYQL